MDRMSPQDAAFLHIEDENTHMHVAFVAIFEGPPPAREEFCRMVRGKLPLVPRYRQKVRFVPFELGRPVWVDDPHFNLDYHVRYTALPAPGGEQQLRNLVGRVMSQKLDRTKPLWEMWVVEGLEDDHWALLSKTHHCMVDGVSATELLTVVLDRDPTTSEPVADDWRPEPEPTDTQLVRDAVTERLTSPYEQMRAWRALLRGPADAARQAADLARAVPAMAGVARPLPETSLNGPIGPHRRWAWARMRLEDVKNVRKALSGTVNDVVLAMCTRGLRDLLIERGEPVEGRTVRALVPVSVRRPEERGSYNNRVSALFPELPIGVADPLERLERIRRQMEGLKESRLALAADELTQLSGFAPPMLLAMAGRLASRIPQRNVQTVITNVPGPTFPLYAVGRRMLHAVPFVGVGGHVRIVMAPFSYLGNLDFGVTGDYDSTPDLDVLCRGIEDGLTELQKLSG